MRLFSALTAAAIATAALGAEHAHDHPIPEKLGTVQFANDCSPALRTEFNRAVALLHSFAYGAAREAFQAIALKDPRCAMAHWGEAMSVFHQLWSPPGADELQLGRRELQAGQRLAAHGTRERELIDAAAVYFAESGSARARASAYEQAMAATARHYPQDDEVQIFHALALIATAPAEDRTHANQKQAAAILEPIYRREPDHPGVAHYLIHAYDSTELAPLGLPAARAYALIAPAAPHALHMPSHIFTRLGLWDDSIASNEAARRAAHAQGDIGEELHAMDYLTYAFLQRGRFAEAGQVVASLNDLGTLPGGDFKISYAATAMPVRLAVEQARWADVLSLEPMPQSPPHVAAIAWWARALGQAHMGDVASARASIRQIDECQRRADAAGDSYWSRQIGVLSQEASAWTDFAAGQTDAAVSELGAAAEIEDALEKLPVTPGPILPAREQLGQMLLGLHRPREALRELTRALRDAPGRRASLQAAIQAADDSGDAAAAATLRQQLGS